MRVLSFFIAFIIISCESFAQKQEADSVALPIFEKVDSEASYPGGEMAWRTFLENTANGHVPADHGAPVGVYTVIIQFVVSKEGKLSNFVPLTKNGYGTEAEVIRILKLSGDWTPAMQNGRNVIAYRKQPVTFVVTSEGVEITGLDNYQIRANTDKVITIKVEKTRTKDLELTLSRGTVTVNPDGSLTLRSDKPGRIILTVFNKKTNKEIEKFNINVAATE